MSKIRKGETVVFVSDQRHLLAVVVDLKDDSDPEYGLYTNEPYAIIEWKDPDLIPRRMRVRISDLKQLPDKLVYINLDMLECECGLKYCRDGGRHSTWCRMYKEDT